MSSETQNPMAEITTGFKRDLLVVAATFEKPSGQDIRDQLHESGYVGINHGRLYPALDDLAEEGLIEKGELDRRTNYYQITEDGRRKLEEYREFVGVGL